MFLLKQPWHLYGLFFPFLLLFLRPCSPERNLDFIFFLMITGIERTFIPFSFFSPSPLVLQVTCARTHTFHMRPDLRSWCVSVNVALTSIFTSDLGLFPSLLPCLHPHLTVPTQVTPTCPHTSHPWATHWWVLPDVCFTGLGLLPLPPVRQEEPCCPSGSVGWGRFRLIDGARAGMQSLASLQTAQPAGQPRLRWGQADSC